MNKKGSYCRIIDGLCQEDDCGGCQAWIDYWGSFLEKVQKEERAWGIIKEMVAREGT